jgi:hypothetical protein
MADVLWGYSEHISQNFFIRFILINVNKNLVEEINYKKMGK